MLDHKEKELLDRIEKEREELEKKLHVEKESLGHLLESANHCVEYANHLLSYGNPVEVASTSQAVISCISSLLSSSLASFPKGPPFQFKETLEKEKRREMETLFSSFGQIFSVGASAPDDPVPFSRDFSEVEDVVQEIGSFGHGDLQFIAPYRMIIDPMDRIFVVDCGNHRIQCLDPEGNFLFKFGSYGNKNGEFVAPRDIAYDFKNNRLLVTDSLNDRIQSFGMDGKFQSTFGSRGQEKGQFNFPLGIAVDHFGHIYVSDRNNHRIQIFDENGNFLNSFGSEGKAEGELKYPRGLGILSNGDVIVSESFNNERGNQRLSVFNSQGHFVRFIGKNRLMSPQWLFVDPYDNILVADSVSKCLYVFSKDGKELKEIGIGTFKKAFGVVISRKGRILISGQGRDDQHRIFVF